jgi:hypothetical protein
VRLRAEAAASIVTVQPFVIVTLSAPVGTTPPDHVAPELQSPPGATQEISSRAMNGGVPNALPLSRSRLLGKDPVGVAADRAWARVFGTAADRATAALERCSRGGGCATETACAAVATGAAGAAGTATGAIRCGLVVVARAVLGPVRLREGAAAGAEPMRLSATSAQSETNAKRKPRCRVGPEGKRMDFKRSLPSRFPPTEICRTFLSLLDGFFKICGLGHPQRRYRLAS